jgi:hypothetical protein
MLAILGSLLGFAGSAVPSIIDIFKSKEEKRTQVEMFKLQLEAKEKGVDLDIRLLEAKTVAEEQKSLLEHDIALGKQGGFINSLRAFVRPFITYVFFLTFIGIKIALVWNTISSGGDLNATLDVVWDEQTETIFAAIVSFWFGSRALEKIKK